MQLNDILSELAIDVARIRNRVELERLRHVDELERIRESLNGLHTTLERVRSQLSEPVPR